MNDKKNKGGRPSKYNPEFCEQAKKLCALGAIDDDLADFFNVSVATVKNWKNAYPEFLDALKAAKDDLDSQVERSLFQRAMGYSHPDTHVSNYKGDVTLTPITKYYPPDPTSCIFWLKNRQPAKWRDRPNANQASNTDLADYLFLSGMKPEQIAEVLNIEDEGFVESYTKRAQNLKSVHKGLLVKAAYDNAMAGDNRMLTKLLEKEEWLEDKVGDSLGDLLKKALME